MVKSYILQVLDQISNLCLHPQTTMTHIVQETRLKEGLGIAVLYIILVQAVDMATENTYASNNWLGIAVLLLAVVALTHGASRILGGHGLFSSLLAGGCFALLPQYIRLAAVALTPCIGEATVRIVGSIAYIISCILWILAIQAVYHFSTGRSLGAAAFLLFIPFVIGAAVFVGVLLLCISVGLLWH